MFESLGRWKFWEVLGGKKCLEVREIGKFGRFGRLENLGG
jgi:hypothetical protein